MPIRKKPGNAVPGKKVKKTAKKKPPVVLCPEHKIPMKKAKIYWGYLHSDLEEKLIKKGGVIIGRCCVLANSPKYGYICAKGNEEYMMFEGKLTKFKD